jgi:hypothetical protein
MSAPQAPAGGLADRRAIHPAADFTPDGRPLFPAHLRYLPPSVIRGASFSIALSARIEDCRAPHETTVAACEGDRFVIRAGSDHSLGTEATNV